MTIGEFNTTLTDLLKDFIKSENHYESGHLYNSVEFRCTFQNEFLDIRLETPEYIYYLDDGTFVDKFFELPSVVTLIEAFVEEWIVPLIEAALIQSLS